MPLNKQAINLNFGQGVDLKTDPFQVAAGKLLSLQNSIFTKGGQLTKRNGFGELASLPNNLSTTATTFQGNLVAAGTTLNILSEDTMTWFNKGNIQPLDLTTIPLARNSRNITVCDAVVAPGTGLTCTVFLANDGFQYYQVLDSQTGQILVNQTVLPSGSQVARVFNLGNYFIITFVTTAGHLQYIAIPLLNPASPSAPTDISTVMSTSHPGYDAYVFSNSLYVAYNASDVGGAIRVTYIDSLLNQHGTVVIAGHTSDLMSVSSNQGSGSQFIWVTFWDSTDNNGYTAAYNVALIQTLAPVQVIAGIPIQALTSSAVNGSLTVLYETINDYGYEAVRTDYSSYVTVTNTGTVSAPTIILRSVGLASKAFYFPPNDTIYCLFSYGGALQPSYFLADINGNIISKLAYSNGRGYAIDEVLPNASVYNNTVYISYLYADQLIAVNKNQGVTVPDGVYAQAGVNLATFVIQDQSLITAELGANLMLSGGILWAYDGAKPVEQNFNVWPEDILVTTTGGGGSITAQSYFYYATYEWTDAQGNLHRSAPSIAYEITTTGSTSTNTIYVPTLRLTYKNGTNPVRIVIYRQSTSQPIPYQITSILNPVPNNEAVDFIQYFDTQSDSQILGNVILYTEGGVVEDIGPPGATTMTLYKSRLFLVDAEDQNLLWFSKQVIEGTPVEMSSLLTLYVAPTISAQGSTGPITALSAMDDKLIVFKKDAIYYMTGDGPDNTGANSDFSDFIFITATVGCMNQDSIVFTPAGLMFQSDKGIWLLGRDLSTSYIGAPVEAYNSASVESALNIPGTNQVRLTLNNGVTLMYDYYYQQWGTFTNIPAESSTVYQGLHTYINSFGQVFQESPGSYLDGSSPVLQSLTTSWLNLSGLQGYERCYAFYLLANYITPHKLSIGIAYDYNPAITQTSIISPNNYNNPYGDDNLYGSTYVYGGTATVEQWRVFLAQQKCEAFQVTITESFDPSFGTIAGAGYTLSGMDVIVGSKGGYPRMNPNRSVG